MYKTKLSRSQIAFGSLYEIFEDKFNNHYTIQLCNERNLNSNNM